MRTTDYKLSRSCRADGLTAWAAAQHSPSRDYTAKYLTGTNHFAFCMYAHHVRLRLRGLRSGTIRIG